MPKQTPETSPESVPSSRERIEKTLKMTDEEILFHIESHPVCVLLEYMRINPEDELVQTTLSETKLMRKILDLCRARNSAAKAIIKMWKGRHAEPIDEFMDKLIEKIPSSGQMLKSMKQPDRDLYLDKINLLKDEENYQRVVIVAKQGLKVNPNTEVFYIELASAAEKIGDRDEALKAWRRALEISPGNGWYTACIKNLEEKLGIADVELPDKSENSESDKSADEERQTKELPSNVREKLEKMSLKQVASYIRKTINTIDDLQHSTAGTDSDADQLDNYVLLLPLLEAYYKERESKEAEEESAKEQADDSDQSSEEEQVRFTDVPPPRFQTLDPVALSAMDLNDLNETITDVADQIVSLRGNLEPDEEESEELKNLIADFRELKEYRKERLEECEANGGKESASDDNDTEKAREDTSEFESKKVDELLKRGDRSEVWIAMESFKGAIELRKITRYDPNTLESLKEGLARLEVFYLKEFGTLIPPKDSMVPRSDKQPDLVDKKPEKLEDAFAEVELPPLPESKESDTDDLLDEIERLSTPPEPKDPTKSDEQMENGDDSAQSDEDSQKEISHIPLPELHTSYKSMLVPDSPDESFKHVVEALEIDRDITIKLSRDMEGETREEADRKVWQHDEDIRRIKRFLRERQYAESLNQDGAIQFRPSSIPGVTPSDDPTNGGTTSEASDLDILSGRQQSEEGDIPLPPPFTGVDLSPEEEPTEEIAKTDEDDVNDVDDEMIIGDATTTPPSPSEPTGNMPAIFAPLTIHEGDHLEIGVLTSNRKGNRLITVEEGAGLTLGQGLPGAQIKVSEKSYYKIMRGDNWSIENGVITFS